MYEDVVACAVLFLPSSPRGSIIAVIGELKHAKFLSYGQQQEVTCFPFIMSSHHCIYIVKCLSTSRDDQFENLGEATVVACEMFTPGVRP